MANRYQYVSIDSIDSEVKEALPCSVIQGSKLLSLLYTLYINEVTIINKLMTDEIYTKLTGDENINKNSTILHDIL